MKRQKADESIVGRHALRVVSLLLGLLIVIGCAGVSFKRGASADSMAADERDCRSSTDNEEQYIKCMRDRGYSMPRLDSMPNDVDYTPPARR